jgi:hypothetical protein
MMLAVLICVALLVSTCVVLVRIASEVEVLPPRPSEDNADRPREVARPFNPHGTGVTHGR